MITDRRKNKLIPLLMALIFMGILTGCNNSQDSIPSAKEVMELTQKVADWQIETFDEMGKYRALPAPEDRKKWHHRDKYPELDWTCAAFYAGLYQFSTIANNPKYINWLKAMGNKHSWMLFERKFHADDHAVGQFYLSLYEQFQDERMLLPTQIQFDNIMYGPKAGEWHWHWCDALFMAPPVWAKLAKVTKDNSFLDYMHEQYQKTYSALWDSEQQLFFRDKSYFNQKENNGNSIFWSRGNGWVFGGLAFVIGDLPESWEHRDFYIDLFKQMAAKLKQIQREDGSWSAGLLGDVNDYPNIETSGTAFFAFGLAWGINQDILDKKEYGPVLLKAWQVLVSAVNNDGMLGYVQPVGAAPGLSYPDYTEVYGSGAFLAAGTEMYKFINKFYPNQLPVNRN